MILYRKQADPLEEELHALVAKKEETITRLTREKEALEHGKEKTFLAIGVEAYSHYLRNSNECDLMPYFANLQTIDAKLANAANAMVQTTATYDQEIAALQERIEVAAAAAAAAVAATPVPAPVMLDEISSLIDSVSGVAEEPVAVAVEEPAVEEIAFVAQEPVAVAVEEPAVEEIAFVAQEPVAVVVEEPAVEEIAFVAQESVAVVVEEPVVEEIAFVAEEPTIEVTELVAEQPALEEVVFAAEEPNAPVVEEPTKIDFSATRVIEPPFPSTANDFSNFEPAAEQAPARICKNCGNPYTEDDLFCVYCGVRLS